MLIKKTVFLFTISFFVIVSNVFAFNIECGHYKKVQVLPSFADYNNGVLEIGTKDIVREMPLINPYLQINKSVIMPETNGIYMVDHNPIYTKINFNKLTNDLTNNITSLTNLTNGAEN
ncbi:MAG: hypothetical protein QXV17_05450 [Candidatus Micrarchaeaceae archaeon]